MLTLNAGFNIGSHSLNIKNSIEGTSTNLASTSSSTIEITGNVSNVDLPSSISALGGFIINNPNGTTLQADLTVSTTLTCTSGSVSTNSHTLTWNGITDNLTESAGNYIVGTLATTRTVASSSSEFFGGIGLSFSSGSDAFSCLVTRYTGASAAVNVGANTGINRKWEITPAANYSGDRNLTLSWLQNDDNGKTLTAMRIYSLAPAASDWVDESGTDQDGSSRSLTKTSLGAITSGTKMTYTISATNSPLPVELTSFTAEATNKGVLLKWTTATEINNYGFEIQRSVTSGNLRGQDGYSDSSDLEGYKTIGFVNGSGNSNSPKLYSFEDNNVPSGNVKYRLKQIDVDGAFEYSDIINVIANIPDKFELLQNYPNPFNPVTTIVYAISSAANVNLTVYDMLGQKVTELVNTQKNPGKYTVTFDGSKISSGVYFYRLTTSNRTGKFVASKKLILMK